jgi:hypothetical protein
LNVAASQAFVTLGKVRTGVRLATSTIVTVLSIAFGTTRYLPSPVSTMLREASPPPTGTDASCTGCDPLGNRVNEDELTDLARRAVSPEVQLARTALRDHHEPSAGKVLAQ